MPYNAENLVFAAMGEYLSSTQKLKGRSDARIVHCINPFPAQPGTEHDRAQRVTMASMDRARKVANVICPNVDIVFAKVTLPQDEPESPFEFDISAKLDRTVLDLRQFQTPRPLPLVMDVLMAVDLAPQDILVFTNVDIAVTPDFYAFVDSLFARGTDCAIINRRTISNIYLDESELSLMASEVGAQHPGFDCFAIRGSLRDKLSHYDSCLGMSGVMLPLVHQLLATADQPVALLDAHATYHLGNDKQWENDAFDDYAEHNRNEIDRVFQTLMADTRTKARLMARLKGAPQHMAFPRRLREQFGISKKRWFTPSLKNLKLKLK